MLILGLEFSSPQRTVALTDHGAAGSKVLGMVSDEGGRAARPLSLIDALLTRIGVHREAIGCLAVGLGPGSYTGIRGAIALAQGWQLARDVKLTGVSSVECLALQAQESGCAGRVDIVIDAQRHEVYLAQYQIATDLRKVIKPLALAKVEDLRSGSGGTPSILIGPEATRWAPHGRVVFPEAQAVARLAGALLESGGGESLEPIYLRQTSFVKAPPRRDIP